MEYKFRQSYIDPINKIITYGSKIITVDKNFTYVNYYGDKITLDFVQKVNFGNPNISQAVACRGIESHNIFRAEMDDFVVVQIYDKKNMIFDRIDFLNMEFRKI
jgi:hypothetical protein